MLKKKEYMWTDGIREKLKIINITDKIPEINGRNMLKGEGELFSKDILNCVP